MTGTLFDRCKEFLLSFDRTAEPDFDREALELKSFIEREAHARPNDTAPPDSAMVSEARKLLAAGNFIEAIRMVRDISHADLKAAKDWVDALRAGMPLPELKPSSKPLITMGMAKTEQRLNNLEVIVRDLSKRLDRAGY